jgi:cytohesin
MAHDVLISYASDDQPRADAVCQALEAAGISCWIAPRDVGPGQQWKSVIVQAIRDGDLVVLVFSSRANASKQVRREVDLAFEEGRPIVPFRIEEVSPERMDPTLAYCTASRHAIDATSDPLDPHLDRLVASVRTLLDKPASPSLPPVAVEDSAAQRRVRRALDHKNLVPVDRALGDEVAGVRPAVARAVQAMDVAERNETLRVAVKRRCLYVAEVALDHGADPNTVIEKDTRYLRSILYYSAEHGLLDFTCLLLEAWADPDGSAKGNPLLEAVEKGHADIVRVLLGAGANPNKGVPLAKAVRDGRADLVEMLLGAGADPDQGDALGDAVRYHHAEIVAMLLEAGADPNQPCGFRGKETPLTLAVEYGNKMLVRQLIEAGADPNHGNLRDAAENGRTEIVQMLLQAGSSPSEMNALMDAVGNGHTDIVQMLLENGADPDQEKVLQRAVWDGHVEIVQLLIDAGADINVSERSYDRTITTPLYAAALKGNVDIVTSLLDAEADPDQGCPLYGACEGGHTVVARMLIDAGTDVNASRRATPHLISTPLHRAVEEGHVDIVTLLVDAGADVNTTQHYYTSPDRGDTPLDLAQKWEKRETDVVRLLRQRGGKTAEELKSKWKLW